MGVVPCVTQHGRVNGVHMMMGGEPRPRSNEEAEKR